MKIIQLTAENIKKLKVVDITPESDVVQVTGKNGSGKSSVLDSIWWALGGTKEIQSMPIRKGEEQARIRLDLGEIVVTRKFLASGNTTLTVENTDGARYQSPQKMLDDLIGELSFDPLAFSKMPASQQYEEIKAIAKIDFDFEGTADANKADYAKRTDVNRTAKDARTRAEAIKVDDDIPEQPIDEAALTAKLASAGEHNAGIDKEIDRRAQMVREKEKVIEQYNAIAQEIIALQSRQIQLKGHANDLQKQLDEATTLPPKIDTADLLAQIEAARVANANLAKKQQRDELITAAEKAEAESKRLTEAMEAREKQKADAIAAAEMPIPSLSLDAGTVFLNGVPFDQASSAEQLRTSVAIAMAANPKLRVIRIKDGSLLDEDGMKIIEEMARQHDYQVWVEKVDSSGKIGIVMEDGAVKSEA